MNALSLRTLTILLTDDSATVREVLRLALESEGYAVIEAPNSRQNVSAQGHCSLAKLLGSDSEGYSIKT